MRNGHVTPTANAVAPVQLVAASTCISNSNTRVGYGRTAAERADTGDAAVAGDGPAACLLAGCRHGCHREHQGREGHHVVQYGNLDAPPANRQRRLQHGHTHYGACTTGRLATNDRGGERGQGIRGSARAERPDGRVAATQQGRWDTTATISRTPFAVCRTCTAASMASGRVISSNPSCTCNWMQP